MSQRKELPDFPFDWDDNSLPYHGFSKYGARRCYRPVLSLNGQQHYFGQCRTRKEAAELYDLLLRFFVAFTPSRAVPNFPATFFDIATDAILGLEDCGCTPKFLLALEDRLIAESNSIGRNVDEYRAQRNAEIKAFRDAPNPLLVAQALARTRAMARLEKFALELQNFPIVRTYSEIEVRGVPGSLLVKDAGDAFLDAKQKLSDTAESLVNLLEAIRATL